MAGALGNSGGRLYSFGSAPVLIDCNFVVDPTNGNNLGIRNLKGQGVKSVFMNVAGSGLPAGSPALGTARSYAVLGASAVTNTGASALTGNLGITPGSSITGFPPGTFSGQEHIADVAAVAAKASAQAAYTAMQALTPTGISSVLNGQTLAAGVYKATSGTAGTFTIDAATGPLVLSGSATDIYIFQTTTTLITGTTGAGAITLGNVKPQNIYWVVGSSATLNSGTASPFYGNVIANASITSTTTGGAISGSLIALTGAVTLSAATAIAAQIPALGPIGANPNPAPGYAMIQLANNYNRYLGGFSGFVSPTVVSNLAINSTALTVGNPYVIVSVGAGPSGQATIAPVADSSGSLAGKYFMLYDSYGNSFCIYYIVNGVGSAPNLGPALSPAQVSAGVRGLSYQPMVIATNATAATQTTALSTLINALPSGVNGVFSFTTSGGGGATLTVISTASQPLAGIPQDGSGAIPNNNGVPLPIYFTISSGSASAGSIWTDGSGNLYTVSATVSSGVLLKTSGYMAPSPAAGTLTFVSGTGSTTALTYSSAVAGLATGFTFAQTVSDTNLADWQAVGVPKGVVPAVGVSFIAKATGAGASSGLVRAPGVSGINSIEVIGDPNVSLAPQAMGGSPNVGGWILVQMLSNGVPVAPMNESICGMSFYVDSKFSPSNVSAH